MAQHPDDSKELDELFRQVGFIVVQWGQAEQSLDLVIATIYQSYGGTNRPKRMPKMLKIKLGYLEKCVREIPELSSFQNQADQLVSEFRSLSGLRHDLIHGAITDTKPVDGAFTFAKLDIKKDFHYLRTVPLDGAAVPRIRRQLIDLGADAIGLASALWEKAKQDGVA